MASVAALEGIGGEVFAAKVQVAVLKKVQDTIQAQGAAAVKLIQAASITPANTPGTLDVRV